MEFLILKHKQNYGYISTNLRTSVWGIAKQAKLDDVLKSLEEDYGNVQFQIATSSSSLDTKKLIAYRKLELALQQQELSEAKQLHLKFGVKNAEI